MPELPEVENTVRRLRRSLVGERVTDIEVRWEKSITTHKSSLFKAGLMNNTILAVGRRGKFVLIFLEHKSKQASLTQTLLIHLRMTGCLVVTDSSNPPHKHDRIIFSLEDGKDLRFRDTRKFGRMWLVQDLAESPLSKLGLDPFDPALTPALMHQLLVTKKRAIKQLLLDQTVLAGIGNIYADEALWHAKISPTARANLLDENKLKSLILSIRKVLNEAIASGGTDNGDNVIIDGNYSPRAYGRKGKPCSRCHGQIKRIVLGQRSTFFCPDCQS